jgi:uncharacterized membrane protein YsdA (DUF1294 family)
MNKYLLFFMLYLSFLALMSIITFFLFKKDKKMASSGGGAKRIKEKTLLGFTALGGALGAFIGRIICHHKTDKSYFSLTIYFSLLCEIALIAATIYLIFMA